MNLFFFFFAKRRLRYEGFEMSTFFCFHFASLFFLPFLLHLYLQLRWLKDEKDFLTAEMKSSCI